MLLGIVASFVTAAGMPYFIVYFGKTLDGLNGTAADIKSVVAEFCIIFVVVGSITLCSGFIQVLTWTVTGERQALRIKEAYVHAILRQDVGTCFCYLYI
jgi:ATP-binding cassette, subfamily B (MDR/TAP), member 1